MKEFTPVVGCKYKLQGIDTVSVEDYVQDEHCQVDLWFNDDIVEVVAVRQSESEFPVAIVWNERDKTASAIMFNFLQEIEA